MASATDRTRTRPRVTVFCGFLGAGKTTLLQNLLKQAEGRRWAAIVNDLASLQVDGPLLRSALMDTPDVPVVELGNGCVCCTGQDDLGEAVARLAMMGDYEHIWIETTGVALPQGMTALFTRPNPFGRALSELVELSAVVCVIDAAHFLREWRAYQASSAPRDLQPRIERPVIEMMIEQVEGTDLILLNKQDLVTDLEMEELRGLVSGLNVRAEVQAIERGQIVSEIFTERVRFDQTHTPRSARWIKLLNSASSKTSAQNLVTSPTSIPHRDRFGISSATFLARRPFRRASLDHWLRERGRGLLRAKGFCWIAEQPDEMNFLSIAGTGVQIDAVAYWWAARVENGKARASEIPPAIQALWQEPAGDRRQELVFIGVGLDDSALHEELTACLA